MNPGNDVPWELPPEYHDEPEPPPEDCLGCGRCEGCIQRSEAFAAEMNDGYDAPHPGDEFEQTDPPDPCPHCDGTGWQDCGVIAIECPECGGDG